MCIAVILWHAHPLYPFLALFNRDEFYSRETSALGWWGEESGCEVLGGRDGVGGGTWLGCNRSGKIAFLTNVRKPLSEGDRGCSKSRGLLPLRFLQSDINPREFASEIAGISNEYNGFNLVVVDIPSNSMIYVTNGQSADTVTVSDVAPGIHVLSNAALDTPWPKALRLRDAVERYLENHKEKELSLMEMAETLMTNTVKDEIENLPGILSRELEYACSSIFVEPHLPWASFPQRLYGTRSTSGLSVTAGGEVTFFERNLEMGKWEHRSVKFHIN